MESESKKHKQTHTQTNKDIHGDKLTSAHTRRQRRVNETKTPTNAQIQIQKHTETKTQSHKIRLWHKQISAQTQRQRE